MAGTAGARGEHPFGTHPGPLHWGRVPRGPCLRDTVSGTVLRDPAIFSPLQFSVSNRRSAHLCSEFLSTHRDPQEMPAVSSPCFGPLVTLKSSHGGRKSSLATLNMGCEGSAGQTAQKKGLHRTSWFWDRINLQIKPFPTEP